MLRVGDLQRGCLFYPAISRDLRGPKRTEHRGSSYPPHVPETTKAIEEELDTPRNSIQIRLNSTLRVQDLPFPVSRNYVER